MHDKDCYGGEGGIRTPDILRYTRFPSERTRPLCDLSKRLNCGAMLTDLGEGSKLKLFYG